LGKPRGGKKKKGKACARGVEKVKFNGASLVKRRSMQTAIRLQGEKEIRARRS